MLELFDLSDLSRVLVAIAQISFEVLPLLQQVSEHSTSAETEKKSR